MDYLKVLRNNNTIAYKTFYVGADRQLASGLTMRCVFAGNEKCSIGHRSLLLDSDSMLVLNKGTQYASCAGSEIPARSFAISFDEKFVADFNRSLRLNTRQLLDVQQNTGSLPELSETLYPFNGDLKLTVWHLKNHLDDGLDNELLINEYLHHCLITYHSLYNQEIYQKAQQLHIVSQSTRIEMIRRLNMAREYLYSNFDRPVHLEQLADNSCLSVNHLLRTFKQAFGQTPHQYLTDIRLQKARLMLKQTEYPVNEIVNSIGFENPSSFIRLFKKKMNTTPMAYRQSA